MEIISKWGYPDPSTLSVDHNGQCMSFVFDNTVTPSDILMTLDYEGHALSILSQGGDLPETFSVLPSPGWEVVTQSPIEALDWATTVITICQQLLG